MVCSVLGFPLSLSNIDRDGLQLWRSTSTTITLKTF